MICYGVNGTYGDGHSAELLRRLAPLKVLSADGNVAKGSRNPIIGKGSAFCLKKMRKNLVSLALHRGRNGIIQEGPT